MSEAYGTIRIVLRLDDKVEIDETVLNEEPRIALLVKKFGLEVLGEQHWAEIEFRFNPAVEQA